MESRKPVTLDAEFDRGLFPSLDNSEPPFWRDGRNVSFVGGGFRPLLKQFDVANPASTMPCRGELLEVRQRPIVSTVEQDYAIPYAFFGNARDLFRFDGSTIATVTRTSAKYTGFINQVNFPNAPRLACMWSIVAWGDWILAAQSQDPIQIMKNGDLNFTALGTDNALGDTFSRAHIIIDYKSFLIAMNTYNSFATPTGGGKDWIHWCSSNDLTKWRPGISTQSSGAIQVRDAVGGIQAAVNHRGQVIFACMDSIHLLKYIGSPYWFGQERLTQRVGAISKGCLISVGNRLYGVDHAGLWSSDGLSFNHIMTPAIQNFFLNSIDKTQQSKTWLWYNSEEDSIELHYPSKVAESGNEVNLVISLRLGQQPNYLNPKDEASQTGYGTWSVLTRARTAGSTGAVFPNSLCLSPTGRLLSQSETAEDEGNAGPGMVGPSTFASGLTVPQGYGYAGYGMGVYGGIQEVGFFPNEYVARSLGDDYFCLSFGVAGAQRHLTDAWFKFYSQNNDSVIAMAKSWSGPGPGAVPSSVVARVTVRRSGTRATIDFTITQTTSGVNTVLAGPKNATVDWGDWVRISLDHNMNTKRINFYINAQFVCSILYTIDHSLTPPNSFVGANSVRANGPNGEISEIAGWNLLPGDTLFSATDFKQMDSLKRAETFSVAEPVAGEPKLITFIPLDGSLNNYGNVAPTVIKGTTKELYVYDFSAEWIAQRISGRIIADALLVLYLTNSDGIRLPYSGGAPQTEPMWIESKDLDMSNPLLSKFIFELIAEIANHPADYTNLKLIVLGRNDLQKPQTAHQITLAPGKRIKPRLPGYKYLAFRFQDDATSSVWNLTKLFLLMEAEGHRG